MLPILGELGVLGKADEGNASGETIDQNAVPNDFDPKGGGGNGGGDEEGGDNTKMLIILAAVAAGGFLLLNK